MPPTPRGRGRGRGGGRGRGTRGRGRGDAKNNEFREPKIGDRVMLTAAQAGFAPPPASGRSTRGRPVQTGTEEIIGYISDHENDFEKGRVKPKVRRIVESSPSPEPEEQEANKDVKESSPRDIVPGQIFRLRQRPDLLHKKKSDGNDGYKLIWHAALKVVPPKAKYDAPFIKDKPHSVLPIPRSQPLTLLNKFVAKKLPLTEPEFEEIKPLGSTTFSAGVDHGAEAETCAKVAGEAFSLIAESPNTFKSLFLMQLPNSLRTFTNKNADSIEEDIKVADHNVGISDDSEVPVFIKGQAQKKPRYHCLTGFEPDQPFGKIQVMKSGRVVLRVGHRVFDILTTAQSHDSYVATLFKLDNSEDRSKPRADRQDETIHVLGKVSHFFTACYDYQRIFKEMDEAKAKAGQNGCLP